MPPKGTFTVDGITPHRIRTSDWSENELEQSDDPPRMTERFQGLRESPAPHVPGISERVELQRFPDRFLKRGKRQIGVSESLYNLATLSLS